MGKLLVKLLTAIGPFLLLAALKVLIREAQAKTLPQEWDDERDLIVDIGNKVLVHFGEAPLPALESTPANPPAA